jgi:hypothetical protein
MIDLQAVRDKTVVVKVAGFPPISATVVNIETAGIWILSQELPSELAQAGASVKSVIKKPVVFIPFSQILFLVATQE